MRRSRPDSYVPPYPAYTSQYPPDQPECVFAQIGVQASDQQAGASRFAELLTLARADGAGRPQHVELGWEKDSCGFRNDVAMLYWKQASQMEDWFRRADVDGWSAHRSKARSAGGSSRCARR